MSVRDMDGPTHAVIRGTTEFDAARLGEWDGKRIPLSQNHRFAPLATIMLVLGASDDVGYRAHPTSVREQVDDTWCIVFHVSPIPVQVVK